MHWPCVEVVGLKTPIVRQARPTAGLHVRAKRCRSSKPAWGWPLRTGSGGSTLAKTTSGSPRTSCAAIGWFFLKPSPCCWRPISWSPRSSPSGLAGRGSAVGRGVALVEAPAAAVSGPPPAGSFRQAALKASAAVVSINTSKAPERHPQANDPWFRFFFGDPGSQPQSGLGSGVIISGRRLHPHQQPRGRGRRRYRGRPQRQSQGARQGDRHRPRHRPGHPQDNAGPPSGHHPGQLRRAAGGRPGAGDRQPLRRGPDRHQRDRQRAGAQPAGHQHLRELHPDRCRHQPGQFGRRAGRRERPTDGDQHGHLFPLGRQHGHRLRHSRIHGQTGARGHREGRRGAPRLDRRRAGRPVARTDGDLRRQGQARAC